MNTSHKHLALFMSGLAGGGAQRRMLTLARAFAARGHRIDVVVARSEGPFRSQLPEHVRLVGLDPVWTRLPGLGASKAVWVLASTPALACYLRRERPDVVLSTSNPANLACLAARAFARVRTPVVVSVNVHLSEATGPRQKAWGAALRTLLCRSYPHADAIIAISDGIADDLGKRTGIGRDRITTIHNPVAVDELQARAREPLEVASLGEAPLLLAVGKLKIQKDFATLIKAFARVRSARKARGAHPARLVILGEGEEREALERLARELGVANDVVMPGFVDNPFAWMSRASVFVLSSAWEGFSNALAEALACGCPVVSTDCPSGPAEILAGGAYGPLVPVGDERALADAILAILETPPDPARLRARAATFSVDAAADSYLEVLEQAFRDAGKGAKVSRWTEHTDTLRSSSTR